MRSFGNTLALLALWAVVARGQTAATTVSLTTAPAPAVAIPRAVVQQVRADIARQWETDTTGLELVWGRVPPSAKFPASTDVRVVGQGEGGWFVAGFTPTAGGPVAVRVRAGAPDSAVMAARTIDAGRPLTAADIRSASRTRWGPPGDPAAPHVGPGWVARHTLIAGAEVTEASVIPPPLVHPGDPVRLEWRRGAVLITLDGVVLDAGSAGQTVRVRVGQSRASKTGTVLATGIVRLES